MRTAKYDQFFGQAINKMFMSVGFPSFDEEFSKQDKWYTLRTWTETQESEFRAWFLKKAQTDLNWSKRTAEKEYSYFNLMYGWAIEEPKPERKDGNR